jgi:hypothetical protein
MNNYDAIIPYEDSKEGPQMVIINMNKIIIGKPIDIFDII